MKIIKKNFSGIALILVELIIGILLLVRPVGFTRAIIIGAGVLMILAGVRYVVQYIRSTAKEATKNQSLTKGLLTLLFGGFCAFYSEWFIITFPALTVIYGVSMLLASLSKVQLTVDALRVKNPKWFLYAISAAVSAICAIVIISNPFATVAVLWMFAGSSLIAEAILDAVSLVMAGRE